MKVAECLALAGICVLNFFANPIHAQHTAAIGAFNALTVFLAVLGKNVGDGARLAIE